MNITVYLGAREGNDPRIHRQVTALGTWIGKNGHTLIYGGSACGLMGEIARSVLAAGGKAIGVEPQFFVDAAVQLEGLTQLIVTKDMSERKAKMIELGDAFIAFPGGTGTLEEIAEVMSKVSLRHLSSPCILFNFRGYYEGLRTQLARMIEADFSTPSLQEGILFCNTVREITDALAAYAAGSPD